MALTFLSRKPDSGLGNIRSSPGDPSRNVDWVLLVVQGLLTVIGCAIVYSASWTAIEGDPYAFVTRQVVQHRRPEECDLWKQLHGERTDKEILI